ncbi:MAG: cell division protein ZapA [Candidatus Aureabacteria bacterium]|nr:cell division protein ZapA [Candidatus Auribacterota bacterium]
MAKSIEVTLFGKQYPVLSDKDEKHVVKVATLVDSKMKEIAQAAPGASYSHLAVMTCLNLADELCTAKERHSNHYKEIDEKINSLIQEINIKLSNE